jgi:PilZ domain-containing protein
MSHSTRSGTAGTDWTRLLADPEVVRHLGKLLQTYRDAPPEKREEALLAAMREIKGRQVPAKNVAARSIVNAPDTPRAVSMPSAATPPFEPDIFGPNWGQDRRRHFRLKCFVAVELRVDEAEIPIWGNLANTSMGGCLVETSSAIKPNAKVEIGLWVASGKIWVKGFSLNGVVTRSARTGVRVRFNAMEGTERESLRQFLKFVQETTRVSRSENSYLDLLK